MIGGCVTPLNRYPHSGTRLFIVYRSHRRRSSLRLNTVDRLLLSATHPPHLSRRLLGRRRKEPRRRSSPSAAVRFRNRDVAVQSRNVAAFCRTIAALCSSGAAICCSVAAPHARRCGFLPRRRAYLPRRRGSEPLRCGWGAAPLRFLHLDLDEQLAKIAHICLAAAAHQPRRCGKSPQRCSSITATEAFRRGESWWMHRRVHWHHPRYAFNATLLALRA